MKVITQDQESSVALTGLRGRKYVWPNLIHGGSPVFLSTIRFIMVPGVIEAVGVSGHGLLEISVGEFTYTSQDELLTMTNSAAVTGLVTTKGTGAGTTITESPASMEGIVSVEKVS